MEDLAARVRPATTASQINKLEKGQRRLTYEWMQRLADALGCTPQALVEPAADPAAPTTAAPTPTYGEHNLLDAFRGLTDGEQAAFLDAAQAVVDASRRRR